MCKRLAAIANRHQYSLRNVRSRQLCGVLLALFFAAAEADALDYVWDGGGGADHSWTNPLNWTLDIGVPGENDHAILNSEATIEVASNITVGAFTMTQGVLTGPGALTIGNFTWTSGTLSGTGTTRVNGILLMIGDVAREVSGRTLNSVGTTDFTAGILRLNDGAVFNNLFVGTFTVSNSGNTPSRIESTTPTAPGVFRNGATFRKTGLSPFSITGGVDFENRGRVLLDPDTGEFAVQGGGFDFGESIFIGSRATFVIETTDYKFSGSYIGGDGTLAVHGATVEFTFGLGGSANFYLGSRGGGPPPFVVSGGDTNLENVTLVDGTLDLRFGRAWVRGLATWHSTTIIGSEGIQFEGGLEIVGNVTRTLSGLRLSSLSSVFRAGVLNLNDGAQFFNAGTFTVGSSDALQSRITTSTAEVPGTFANGFDGTFTKVGTSDFTMARGIAFENYGRVEIASGNLAIGGPFVQVTGTTHLQGGNLTSVVDGTLGQPFVFEHGRLIGSGTITAALGGNVSGVVNNGAIVSPGDGIGRLNIIGNYTQTECGSLEIEMAGATSAGSDFDQLTVSNVATLDGVLRVGTRNGFRSSSDRAPAVTYGSHSGTFARANAQVTYESTAVQVSTVPVATTMAPLLNVSTRLQVETGENVLIAGFIITGSGDRRVILRAVRPFLGYVAEGRLEDPVLELYRGDAFLASNDNWKESQQAEIEATGIAPTDDAESAVVRTLAPGAYTAVMKGANGSTGIGVIEAYDLDQAAEAGLANISSRGFVRTDDSVMIAGFILGLRECGDYARIVVRALGPSLEAAGVANVLRDPTLEIYDINGTAVGSNDDWQSGDPAELEAVGLAPAHDKEAALILPFTNYGNYTAVVRGNDGSTGVGLVEVYNIQ